ncbi:MAG: indolepyruvate oxidoreductase subunit beta [Desulfovibrionaceae bacterium]|nr:indolepyruvate oxidoreductase subunit beta [Desulfovibrionaceae bacterium]
MNRIRIYMTGVGGQGTLTATTLLSRIAVDEGVDVVAGEIHGMAQRGGVVESTVLMGGWKSPKLDLGEADIVLGFEPLEALRGLRYLRQGGYVFGSSDAIPTPGMSSGKEKGPSYGEIINFVKKSSSKAWFFPARTIGLELGSPQCGNNILLGALCASNLLPFGLEALERGICRYLPGKLQACNIEAARRGAALLTESLL